MDAETVETDGDTSYMRENEVEEHSSELNESSLSIRPKTEVESEKEQVVFSLQHVDIETLIKSDMKQLVLAKVTEEVSLNALNDLNYQVEEQKLALEKQLEEWIRDIDTIKRNISNTKEETEQKQIELKEIKKQFEIKNSHEEKAQQNYDVIWCQLNEFTKKRSKELEEAKTKYELLQTKQDKYLTELKKTKEYFLETFNYLTDKSQSFKTEIEEMEKVSKNSQNKNQSLRRLIEEKQNPFNEKKQKLEMSKKKGGDVPLRSGLKTLERQNPIKKVQFNALISFKSATESSETSSQPVAQVRSTLEASINDWLQDISDTEIYSNKVTSKQSEDKN